MSERVSITPGFGRIYPERADEEQSGWVESSGRLLLERLQRRWRSREKRARQIVREVHNQESRMAVASDTALSEIALDLRHQFARRGLDDRVVATAFAMVREVAGRKLGMKHYDEQVLGGWALLNGMVAEMQTGEGKTLTASLPACVAAMAGIPVHVVTVNDYLVIRDCEELRPVYEALGLTVASVTPELSFAQRQQAYRSNIVYCSNKTLVFDYLRDRIVLSNARPGLQLELESVYSDRSASRRLLLRGLSFAIVDEADSVLIDEARTPLIISAENGSEDEARVAAEAIDLSRGLVKGKHWQIEPGTSRVALLSAGRVAVADRCEEYGGIWTGAMRRDEMLRQALTALHLLKRDVHYIVRDESVQIVDESTGRVMADRSWGEGLQQMVEAKEGCPMTSRKETLARISYQRFFRRYLHLSGMTGTAREVSGELSSIYGLGVTRIPTHRPERRRKLAARVFATQAEKWSFIAQRVKVLSEAGIPVLLGTRSVAASEIACRYLVDLGIVFRLLNAKQDREEAEIIAQAGGAGQITIATNMAGRGTDIHIDPAVIAQGGLHVILSELHESRRIDRQLSGRCARQGEPGQVELYLSLEDPLLEGLRASVLGRLADGVSRVLPGLKNRIGLLLMQYAQYRLEIRYRSERKRLLRVDRLWSDTLAFSGTGE